VTLQSLYPLGSLFFTLDGSDPSFASTEYSGPITVGSSAVLRAISYSADFSDAGELDPIVFSRTDLYTLTRSTVGGGSIAVAPSAASYFAGTVVFATASPSAGWTFMFWQGDVNSTNPVIGVPLTRNKKVQAVFGTTLRTTVSGNGLISVVPALPLYAYGTVAQVIATPLSNSYFGAWGNSAFGTTNPLRFAMVSANPVISSVFGTLNAGQFALNISASGDGTVSANPRSNTYANGATVTLTATPNTNQVFLGWTGDASGAQNPLVVSMTQSRAVTANFSRRFSTSTPTTPSLLGQEGFKLLLGGAPGSVYSIDASSDIVTWTNLAIVTNFTGSVQFDDPFPTNQAFRFYRAVPVP
jgi:hypothetical protein